MTEDGGHTVTEAADALGYGTTKVFGMVKNGTLESEQRVISGRKTTIIRKEEIDRLMEDQPVVYTVRELAAMLRMGETTLARRIRSGEIAAETRTGTGGWYWVVPESEAIRLTTPGAVPA